MLKTKDRNISYDLLRIIAIMMVLYNHREAFSYFTQVPFMGLKYIFTISATIFSRCGPPLFFMISGALLLGKNESFSKILKSRILRMLIVMLALSIYAHFVWGSGTGISDIFSIFSTRLNWYLYSYIAYLFMLPFLRTLVQNMDFNQRKLFLILTTIIYTICGVFIPFSIHEQFTNNMTFFNATWASHCWHITFPILGYILVDFSDNETDANKKKQLFWILLIGTLLSIALTILLLSYDITVNGNTNQEQILQHNILIPCCFILYVFYDTFKQKHIHNSFFSKLLAEFSGATFGIFLIETHTTYSTVIFNHITILEPYIGRYMCSIVSIFCEFAVYFVVIFILRKIPYIKKLL